MTGTRGLDQKVCMKNNRYTLTRPRPPIRSLAKGCRQNLLTTSGQGSTLLSGSDSKSVHESILGTSPQPNPKPYELRADCSHPESVGRLLQPPRPMPLQRAYGTGLNSLEQFLLRIDVTDQLADMNLDVEPMDWEPTTPPPPPAAPVADPPPAPRKRERSTDDNDLPDCKRRRLDFDNV